MVPFGVRCLGTSLIIAKFHDQDFDITKYSKFLFKNFKKEFLIDLGIAKKMYIP